MISLKETASSIKSEMASPENSNRKPTAGVIRGDNGKYFYCRDVKSKSLVSLGGPKARTHEVVAIVDIEWASRQGWRSLETIKPLFEKCRDCGGSGQQVEYVSHEMALDAGEPLLEGQVFTEGTCPACHGRCLVRKTEPEKTLGDIPF